MNWGVVAIAEIPCCHIARSIGGSTAYFRPSLVIGRVLVK